MKKFLFFLLLLSLSVLLLSCRTTKASVSDSEKSEKVATSADRLSYSLMTDSTNRWFTLSVDSMIILFAQPFSQQESIEAFQAAALGSKSSRDAVPAAVDDMYFLSYKPPAANSGSSSPSGDKHATVQQPAAVSIYGLHIDAGDNKKSSVQSSAKDSVAETKQSYKAKAKEVRKSAPSKAPQYIFYILIIACALYGIYRFRNKLKKMFL